MINIRTLAVKFKNQLKNDEIKLFRGAVIHALDSNDILFHNHTDENYRYAYPLIQYKLIDHCASIFCIENGVESIGLFFSHYDNHMRIGERDIRLEIDFLRPEIFPIRFTDHLLIYRLKQWLPLNHNNYNIFQTMEKEEDRIMFLQKILTGNILSCMKGLNIYLDEKLECKIHEITRIYSIPNKRIHLLACDIIFSCNMALPKYMGIGKNASINCGILIPVSKVI